MPVLCFLVTYVCGICNYMLFFLKIVVMFYSLQPMFSQLFDSTKILKADNFVLKVI